MEVPERVPMKVTLTTRGLMTPDAWRRAWKRFRTRCVARGVPLVYRVELQRRKTPHVHAVAWFHPGGSSNPEAFEDYCLFFQGWLECVDEQDDPASVRHAVDVQPVRDEGWTIYMALHNSKHKREQLGWLGKQWGVIGREAFKRRDCIEREITDGQRVRLQRLLRRHLAGHRYVVGKNGGLAWTVDQVHALGIWRLHFDGMGPFKDARAFWRAMRRKGNWRCAGGSTRDLPQVRAWLRCIPAWVVHQALNWVMR